MISGAGGAISGCAVGLATGSAWDASIVCCFPEQPERINSTPIKTDIKILIG